MEHKTIPTTNKTQENTKDPEVNLIDFYLQPEFMHLIAQQIAAQPQVDPEKVSAIKQSILHKNFKIDPDKLAEKMIKFEYDLFNLKPKV